VKAPEETPGAAYIGEPLSLKLCPEDQWVEELLELQLKWEEALVAQYAI